MNEKNPIRVCVSGYFTVLHKGHIKLFEDAKALGDKLIVIINNHDQQFKKKRKNNYGTRRYQIYSGPHRHY